MSTPLPPHLKIYTIVTAAICTASEGMADASSSASAVATSAPLPGNLSVLKLLNLRYLCGVAINEEIPSICSKVHACSTKQAGLSLLVQYLMAGMGVCRREFFGHAEIIHCSVTLYNFVAGDRFTNPGENPSCPAGDMYDRTRLLNIVSK